MGVRAHWELFPSNHRRRGERRAAQKSAPTHQQYPARQGRASSCRISFRAALALEIVIVLGPDQLIA